MGRLHRDPNIYTEPFKFNPSQYAEDRTDLEDKKEVFAFLGWGRALVSFVTQ